jgi:hypothetical protein
LISAIVVGSISHIRFEVRDRVVAEVFREDELVVADLLGCCVAHHPARDIGSLCEGWRSRSMIPTFQLDNGPGAFCGSIASRDSTLATSVCAKRAAINFKAEIVAMVPVAMRSIVVWQAIR